MSRQTARLKLAIDDQQINDSVQTFRRLFKVVMSMDCEFGDIRLKADSETVKPLRLQKPLVLLRRIPAKTKANVGFSDLNVKCCVRYCERCLVLS